MRHPTCRPRTRAPQSSRSCGVHRARGNHPPHDRTPALELRRAEILEQVLRALHAMEHALRAVGERHDRILDAGVDPPANEEVAPEEASVAVGGSGLAINAYRALGEARDARLDGGRTEHADVLARSAHDAGHRIDGVGNACARTGSAGDAGERAGEAIYAGAEERHGTKGSAGKRRSLDPVALA